MRQPKLTILGLLLLPLCAAMHAEETSKPKAMEPQKEPLSPRNDLPGLTNFAKVSETLYRGAQPTAEGFAELKKMGVKTIINLRSLHSDRDIMAGNGFQYVHLNCKPWHPEEEDVLKFLKVARDPKNQPVLVHCEHGADRTGMMVAVYRMVEQGWNLEDAAKELPSFGFHKVFAEIQRYLQNFKADEVIKKVDSSPSLKIEVID